MWTAPRLAATCGRPRAARRTDGKIGHYHRGVHRPSEPSGHARAERQRVRALPRADRRGRQSRAERGRDLARLGRRPRFLRAVRECPALRPETAWGPTSRGAGRYHHRAWRRLWEVPRHVEGAESWRLATTARRSSGVDVRIIPYRAKRGLCDLADKGSIFFDEIGKIPMLLPTDQLGGLGVEFRLLLKKVIGWRYLPCPRFRRDVPEHVHVGAPARFRAFRLVLEWRFQDCS